MSFLKNCHKIDVHGHRGARGLFPENTIPAFKSALEGGVDFLEMDLGVTKDNILVICHDPFLNPLIVANLDCSKIHPGLLIRSLMLDQLKKFDCGGIRNPLFESQCLIPGTRIPTLDEVFGMVRDSSHHNAKKIRFNIETKIFPCNPEYTVDPLEFSELVIQCFQKSGFLNRIVLQSFDPRTLIEAKRLEPSIITSLLVDEYLEMGIDLAQRIGANIISPNFSLLNKKLMTQLHQTNLQIVPWTLNNECEWQLAAEFEVNGIITDYPFKLIEYLNKLNDSAPQ